MGENTCQLNGWERPRGSRGTKHREREDEDHHLSSPIKGATQNIVVLAVPSRVVSAQPELRCQPNENGRADGGVYPAGLEWTRVCYQRGTVFTCSRWETHQRTGELVNDRQYDVLDLDGTDVVQTLQYRIASEISVIQRENSVFVYLTDKPMHECRSETDEYAERDDEVRP